VASSARHRSNARGFPAGRRRSSPDAGGSAGFWRSRDAQRITYAGARRCRTAGISDELSRLLHEAGIVFRGSSTAAFVHGELKLRPGGVRVRPGRVVALALLEGPQIAGLPSDAQGFIPVTELGEVRGLDGVYAAGDATAYPIKHGGVAAQQADVVAAAIAARAGLTGDPQPLQPVIRGALLTGLGTRYLEATPIGDGGFYSTVSDVCPWDPPTKIAAHHPGPYLARGDRHAVRA